MQHATGKSASGCLQIAPSLKRVRCAMQDVTSRQDGRLIGRAFVSAATLMSLQGSISATLLSPQLELVRTRKCCTFRLLLM